MAIYREFDTPIYKVLAHNDTGQASGHQGGFVLPKDLENFFPLLRNRTSAANPTVDCGITADLFDGDQFIETAETRYQYQTWGGERSPERRITGNISRLRNLAHKDEILIIERSVDLESHYRFTLIRKSNSKYTALISSFGGKRWGILNKSLPPVDELAVESAEAEIGTRENLPFVMFDAKAGFSESRVLRIARCRAFQRRVRSIYGNHCSVCGSGLLHPNGTSETEAAHIVPRALKGSDDPRNGLLLCKSHHWAFDRGIIGVSKDYSVIIPTSVSNIPENSSLLGLKDKKIVLPTIANLAPNIEAIKWHIQNVLID